MPPPSLDERTRLAERLIAQTWPHLRFADTRVPAPGMDHAVIVLRDVIDTSTGTGESAAHLGDLVVRAPLTSDYRAQSGAEAAVLDELRVVLDRQGSGVRIPRPVLRTPDGTIGAQTFVEGTPVTAAAWAAMPSERQEIVVDELAELLAAMHTRDVDRPPFNGVESWWLPTEHRELTEAVHGTGLGHARLNISSPRALPAKAAKVAATAPRVIPDDLSDADRDVVEEIIRDVSAVLRAPFAPRLVHSDLYDAHALWDGQHLGVIDFSDMNRGDPAIDFSHLTDLDPMLAEVVLARAKNTSVDGVRPEYDEGLLDRAWIYKRWDSVFLLVDHLRTGFTSGDEAWEAFAAVRDSRRPGTA